MTNDETQTASEMWDIFTAAVHAVAPGIDGIPDAPPPLVIRSGRQLWDWAVSTNGVVRELVRDLDDEQSTVIRQVIDGMLRERVAGSLQPALSRRLH